MILPQTSIDEWCDMYGLEVTTKQCQGCKEWYPVNIPFALKGYRGLMMKDHGCRKEFGVSIARPVGESISNLRKILTGY